MKTALAIAIELARLAAVSLMIGAIALLAIAAAPTPF